jgi:sphinganine-1-phosphate aldolase
MVTRSVTPARMSRWAILAGYGLLAACSQLLWLSFAPITTQTHQVMGVSEGAVGDLAGIFPLMYVVLALPCGRWLDARFERALSVRAILTAGGALLRLAAPSSSVHQAARANRGRHRPREAMKMDPNELMASLELQLKPYRGEFPSFPQLPEDGLARAEVTGLVERLAAAEESRWRDGFASGAVYHGDPEHIAFLNRVYAAQSQSNPLHPDLWPSATKFEAEIVSMTARMLGAEHAPADAPVVGTVNSGGTESILLAMKTYRDFARERRGIAEPEIVAPVTAHAAFDKAARYFDMPLVRVGVDEGFKADLDAVSGAISERTAVVVGSAPSFPHGVIDPIPELAALAAEHGAGCHVDACLGGFIVPWAERLGYPVPPFDFRLPGVTSMSADAHKYGYAAKGSSVVLYRGKELRQFQFYTTADWPGGLYLSPTFAGSRPGALSAECWAAMVSIGERGYLDAARRILETGARVRDGVRAIPGVRVLGDPLWVTAFATDEGLDVFQVMENMARRGWSLNGLQRPAAVHIAITLRHTLPGVADRFLEDLRASIDEVRANPDVRTGLAPIYGMAASLPEEVVRGMLGGYLDLMFEV